VAASLLLGAPFDLPEGVGDPVVLFWLVLFALFGFGFWFTLFAVVAATISDPNSSSRSALLFLPFLPLGLTVAGLDQPDSLWMRLLSLLPGLSPAAMPVRLLRGAPGLIEILLSLALLALAVCFFRRAAGRVFGTSMMMTGKEPRWSELWRWMRES
jgi:ABC-2 type transport system permease protein